MIYENYLNHTKYRVVVYSPLSFCFRKKFYTKHAPYLILISRSFPVKLTFINKVFNSSTFGVCIWSKYVFGIKSCLCCVISIWLKTSYLTFLCISCVNKDNNALWRLKFVNKTFAICTAYPSGIQDVQNGFSYYCNHVGQSSFKHPFLFFKPLLPGSGSHWDYCMSVLGHIQGSGGGWGEGKHDLCMPKLSD